MDNHEKLRKSYGVIQMIGMAMMGSLLTYTAVTQLVSPGTVTDTATLRIVFYVLSAGCLVTILVLKNFFLQKKSEDKLGTLIEKLTTYNVITLALCEVPAVSGLVLYFIGGNRKDFYILASYSLLLLVLFFPKFNQWQEYATNAKT